MSYEQKFVISNNLEKTICQKVRKLSQRQHDKIEKCFLSIFSER